MRASLLAIALYAILTQSALAQAHNLAIDVHDASLPDVLSLLASESATNIVADSSLKAERVTLHLQNVTLEQALSALVESYDLAVRRAGSVLIVGAAEAMNRHGTAGSPLGTQTTVLVLAHADVGDIAKNLEHALPPGTVVISDKRSSKIIVSGSSTTVATARRLASALDSRITRGTASVTTQIYRLRYLRPSETITVLKGAFAEGVFVADDSQNAVIVNGNDDLQQTVAQFLRGLDVPTPQVLFEVRVADVEPINEQSDIGFQFGGYDLSGQPLGSGATYAFARNSLAINARLNALVSSGHARILATPKLLTLNNHEADLLIGETYPVVYYDARLGGQQVQFVDIGVKLRMTPTIGSDGSVTAEMHPEYSAIEGFVGGYPVLTNRKVDSTLRAQNNETIVLGGLLREIDSETITKLPWLSDIPILGKLFQDRQRMHRRDEVIFLITPHVLLPPVEARR